MKACGIVAEYNPLHTGHVYQMNKARQISQADCIIVVMSGNFVQRGEPAVIDKYARTSAALKAGADIVGAEDLMEKIQAGDMPFDRCIATPDMMGLVGRVGKILGPRGLMPNPKLGTVTMDVAEAVKSVKGGQVEYRTEKAGIVHAGVGKASFTEKAILENVKSYVDAVIKAKPTGVKGTYVKSMSLSSTMGPAVKFDVAE